MKCCSVSITLLHILTAVSAVMVLAASSYALDSKKWMHNDSFETEEHEGIKAYEGLHEFCFELTANGKSSTKCSDLEAPGDDASDDSKKAWESLKATRGLVPCAIAGACVLLILSVMAARSVSSGQHCVCGPQVLTHWVFFVAFAAAILTAAALGSYGVHIEASNDVLAGGSSKDLDDDAKWKPGDATDAMAGALAMSALGAVCSLLASLAACSCLPQGCCVEGNAKKQEPLLG